jgi:hypothetical protein
MFGLYGDKMAAIFHTFLVNKVSKQENKNIENKTFKLLQDQFEDTKGLIRSRQFKKNSNNTMAKRKRPTGPTTT